MSIVDKPIERNHTLLFSYSSYLVTLLALLSTPIVRRIIASALSASRSEDTDLVDKMVKVQQKAVLSKSNSMLGVDGRLDNQDSRH